MDDKLLRLARKIKSIEDDLSKITQIKDLEGLLFVNTEITNKYKKSINDVVNTYKDYISRTQKELSKSMSILEEESKQKTIKDKKSIDNLDSKINKIKEDIKNICVSIDKSIEDIQKDILKDIQNKNNEIISNIKLKDKEISQIKKENEGLNKNLVNLKDMLNKLELKKGDNGKSAYEIACELGFKGTVEEWIKSLHGKDGKEIELRGMRAFSDAPKDNKTYGRKNKKWIEITGEGTSDYNDLNNKPSINNVELDGNKSLSDLGIQPYDDTEVKEDIEKLQTENARLKATLPTTTGEGQDITLDKTAEFEFIKPPLPRGNSEQFSTTGANLLPTPNAETKTDGGVTVEYNGDGSYTITGTPSRDFTITFQVTEKNMPTNSYIHLRNTGTTTYNVAMILRKDSIDYGTFAFGANNRIVNKTTENQMGVNKIVFYGNSSSAGTALNITLQPSIELTGDTTSYEPYTNGASPNPDYPQEITNVTGDVEVKVQNGNLYNNVLSNDINKTNCSISYDNGEIVLNATGTDAYIGEFRSVGSSYNAICGQLIKVKPNTKYTVQNTNPLFNKNFINYWNKDKTVTKQVELMGGSSTRTFTTEFNTEYITFRTGYAQTVSGQQYKFNITVIEGDYTSVTIPSYTPHKEQILPLTLGNIELCKIGDYQDYFYKQSNKWYLHKEIAKKILDGSENWTKSGAFTNSYFLYIPDSMNIQTTDINIYVYCNNYRRTYYSNILNYDYSCILSNNKNVMIHDNSIDNVEDFKTWLSTHNTTVYYVLATPTDTEITDTTLISQLKAINNALSYEEQTNISSNTIALFNVEAYQSTKLVLEENNAKYESLEARVALLE